MDPNGPSGTKVHCLDLERISINGYFQPLSYMAKLTLHEDSPFGNPPTQTSTPASTVTYRHFMKVHVDGEILAEWDLDLLVEQDLIGGGYIYGFADRKMVELMLPLVLRGQNEQPENCQKMVRLFLATQQDFHTAVNYLTKDVGLRHVGLLKKTPSILSGTAVHQSQGSSLSMQFPMHHRAPSASGFSTMRPPMRTLSRGMHVTRSPASFARQDSTRPAGIDVRLAPRPPRRPLSAIAAYGVIRPQRYRYPPPDVVNSEVTRQPRWQHTQSSVTADSGDPTQPYDRDFQARSSQTDHRAFSRPVGYSNDETGLSQQEVNGDELGDHNSNPVHNLRRVSVRTNFLSSSTLKDSNADTYYSQQSRPSSSSQHDLDPREPYARPRSQPGSASELGVPVKIQFLDPASRLENSNSHPKTRWEFTLNLPPSTKIQELCFHAASHLKRHFGVSIDGMMLEARDEDGDVFDGQANISKAVLNSATIFLTECVLATVQRPCNDSSLDPLRPNSMSNASSSQDLHHDRGDQVPPPRKLPFTSVRTGTATNATQLTAPSRPPLTERPDLANRDFRTALQGAPGMDGNTEKVAGKRRPASRQGPPASTPRQSASSAQDLAIREGRPISVLGNISPTAHTGELGTSQEVAKPTVLHKAMTRSATARMKKAQAVGDQKRVEVVPAVTKAQNANETARTGGLAQSPCMRCRNTRQQCDLSMPICGLCEQSGRKCIRPKVTTDDEEEQNRHNSMTSGGQMPASAPVTHASARTQGIAVQTEEIQDTSKDVEMKDAATNTLTTCIDAAVDTAKCDDMWLPYFQSLELMSWARDRYDEQLKKAVDVLRNTDPSREDYRYKVHLAAQYGVDFELELREMCGKVLQNSH